MQGPVKFNSLGENLSATAFIFQWQNGKFVQVLPAGDPGSVKILYPKPHWALTGPAEPATDPRSGTELRWRHRQIYSAIVDGILGGGVYALMAVGLTLIFGVLDIINIAQGILVVTGAYLSYVLSVHLHIDLFLGLLVTVPAMFVLGLVIYWAFIRPLRGSERTSMSLLACYAVAIIIEGVLYWIFGANEVTLQRLLHHSTASG